MILQDDALLMQHPGLRAPGASALARRSPGDCLAVLHAALHPGGPRVVRAADAVSLGALAVEGRGLVDAVGPGI